jgi:redox-sensitive bicupin YhaK (pirin superfamily)
MIEVRRSQDRGQAHHGWLKSLHTFSFADYYDPGQMGFRALRVINEDRIQGGSGFGSHPHRDMEIISYVISGALEHKDSMGNRVVIRPGEVQRMSAGTGVVHSESNHFPDQETHFFQIWIQPQSRGGQPSYGQKSFESELSQDKLVLVVSQDGREGSLEIRQDADIYLSRLSGGDLVEFRLRSGRGAWVQVLKGEIQLNEQTLVMGDAARVDSESLLKMKALTPSELMLFDLQ